MLINRRNAMMTDGKRTPTAKDYVQDGLVAMWDGIENAGWGVHDPNATTWIELISEVNNFTGIASNKWTDNGVIISTIINSTSRLPSGVQSFEIVMDLGSFATSINNTIFFPVDNPSVGTYRNCYMLKIYPFKLNGQNAIIFGAYQKLPIVGDLMPRQVSCSFGFDGVMTSIYFDGVPATLGESEYHYKGSSYLQLRWSGNHKVHCMRAYNGIISQAVREHNYAIDKARFNLP